MNKYEVEYSSIFLVFPAALLSFKVLSFPKSVLVFVFIHLESLLKKSYYGEILLNYGRILNFSKRIAKSVQIETAL